MEESPRTVVSAFNCPNCGAAVAPDSVRCPYCRSAIATRVCPSCYGAVMVGTKHCQTCGAAIDSTEPEEGTKLLCPRCRKELSTVPVGRTRMHECLQCGGLWLTRDSFQNICTRQEEQEAILSFRSDQGTRPPGGQNKTGRAYIPCPVCGKLMNRENFAGCSGVILDWCRNHGSWFDRLELQQIVGFIKNGGLRKSRDRELARIREEKEQLRTRKLELDMRSCCDAGTLRLPVDSNPGGDTFLNFLTELLLR